MNYLLTTVSESSFIHFLKELRVLYEKYGSHIKNKDYFIGYENIDLIIEAGYAKMIFSNVGQNLVEACAYIGNDLRCRYTAPVSDEIHCAAIFMGTTLFSNLNKTSISELNFINKKMTEIWFLKNNSSWNIIIDITF